MISIYSLRHEEVSYLSQSARDLWAGRFGGFLQKQRWAGGAHFNDVMAPRRCWAGCLDVDGLRPSPGALLLG
jgi:hypothetical protein